MEGAIRRVPAIEDAGITPDDQRARGVHAGQRVHPRRERGPRVLRRRRVLRPRHRRRRRHRPADGQLDRRRRAGARPLEDGHPPVRRPVPLAAADPGPHRRELRDLLRHPLPERGAPGRPAAADSRRLRAARARSAPSSARSPAGSARTGSSPTRTTRGSAVARRSRRSGRAAGPASTGRPAIGAEALATRHGRGALRRDSASPRSRSSGPARSRSSAAVRQRRRPAVGADRLHRRCSTAAAASSATSRSPGSRADRFLIVTGHRVRQPRPRLDPQAPPARTAAVRARRRHVRRASASGCGARGRATSSQPLTKDDLSDDAFPYLTARRDHDRRRAGARAPRHVRRRARLGAVRPDRVRPRAVGHALGRRAGRTGSSPAATAPSTPSGSRRATASGRATSRPRRRRTRRASGSPSRSTRASTSSAARRSSRAQGGGPAQAPALPRPRRSALGVPRQRAGPDRRRDRRPGDVAAATASPSSARSPSPTCRPTPPIGTRGEVEVFGEWVGFEVVREPLWDPTNAADPRADDATARGDGREWSADASARPGGGAARLARASPMRLRRDRRDRARSIPARACGRAQGRRLVRDRRRHGGRARDPRADRRSLSRRTGWSARSTASRGRCAAATRWYIDPIDGTHNFLRGVPHLRDAARGRA